MQAEAVVRKMEGWRAERVEAAVGVCVQVEQRGCWVWMVAGEEHYELLHSEKKKKLETLVSE